MAARLDYARVSDLDRFLSKLEWEPNGCWTWTASRYSNGYGQFFRDGRVRLAHRESYMMFVGSIPEGLDLDHLCRVRECVRPSHPEPVTRSQNLKRGIGVGGRRVRRGR